MVENYGSGSIWGISDYEFTDVVEGTILHLGDRTHSFLITLSK